MIARLALAALRRLEPETAHALALRALRAGLGPRGGAVTGPRLRVRLFGCEAPNPVGLAAGFDKNAEAVDALLAAGFGFVEIGAITPRPQPGNPRPRLFRLPADRAVINRFGFNNDGLDVIAGRLAARRGGGIVGANLGANRDSADRAGDYVTLIEGLRGLVDFATINVSSPNTPGLRGLQDRAALDALLGRCARAAGGLPLALKISPDLDDGALDDVARVADAHGLAAVIATNTTTARDGLRDPNAAEAGGLSGRPLFARSTAALRRLAARCDTPLIGVGGVGDASAARAKLAAGARAVQLYTALVYEGPGLAGRIARTLDAMLAAEGLDGPGAAAAAGAAAARAALS